MRRVIAVVVSAGLGLTALGAVALADKGPGVFERSDKDGDGFVTKEEFAAGRELMFSQIDANGDGALDQAELDKAHEAFRQRASESGHQLPPPEGDHHGRFMKRLDTNEDGKITAEEFVAAGERMFAKLDDNGDGKLAKDEMRHHRRHDDDPAAGEAPVQ
jgi:Ca2+-binding EF-hand superfamily protein